MNTKVLKGTDATPLGSLGFPYAAPTTTPQIGAQPYVQVRIDLHNIGDTERTATIAMIGAANTDIVVAAGARQTVELAQTGDITVTANDAGIVAWITAQ